MKIDRKRMRDQARSSALLLEAKRQPQLFSRPPTEREYYEAAFEEGYRFEDGEMVKRLVSDSGAVEGILVLPAYRR